MKKLNNSSKQQAIISALGSVRAEGLKPSKLTQKRLIDYANGKITAKELNKVVLSDILHNRQVATR